MAIKALLFRKFAVSSFPESTREVLYILASFLSALWMEGGGGGGGGGVLGKRRRS